MPLPAPLCSFAQLLPACSTSLLSACKARAPARQRLLVIHLASPREGLGSPPHPLLLGRCCGLQQSAVDVLSAYVPEAIWAQAPPTAPSSLRSPVLLHP